jgi:hypothetical protein
LPDVGTRKLVLATFPLDCLGPVIAVVETLTKLALFQVPPMFHELPVFVLTVVRLCWEFALMSAMFAVRFDVEDLKTYPVSPLFHAVVR